MFLVDKDGNTVYAKWKPDPPGGRGVDHWQLNICMCNLNDHGLYVEGYDIPEKYQKYKRPKHQINYRQLLIDAIKVPAEIPTCVALERLGWLSFVGNQHNPAWSWKRSMLGELTERALEKLYLGDYEWLVPDIST